MDTEINILIVEDSPDDAHLLVHEITQAGLKIRQERVETERQMRSALEREAWDVILCDYSIPNFGALPALKLVKEMKIKTPFIVISGVMGEETAISVMKAGAHDFITKGNYIRLVPAIQREMDEYLVRKKAIDEAKKQKQLAFTMIMQNPMPLIIFSTNLDIKLANESFLTLCGWSEERLQKMSMKEFKVLEKSGHGIKEAIQTKKGVIGDVVVEFPTGIKYLEQHTIPLLDKDGEIVSMMTTYQDNTEKRKTDLAKKELADFTASYLDTLSSNLGRLATGNIEFDLTLAAATENTKEAHNNFAGINNNLTDVRDALSHMIDDAKMLAKAAIEGKLDTRADATRHIGEFRTIVEGVNATLDSVIGPLNVAAEYVDRISKGDLPAKITDRYNGDFNEIKNNLNNCIDNINALVTDANMLAKAAVEGKLDTRADATKHQGDYRRIVEGVNETLDSVIGPLNVAAEYVDRISKGEIPQKITDKYNGDFNEIKNTLNACIDAINGLVADANMLAKAAVEGRLDARADATKHQGDYRRIVEGVDATLDSVIGPLNVAAEYVDRISKGEIPQKITDKYNGDFNEIKNNLNACIDGLQGLVECDHILHQMSINDHSTGVEGKYLGIFASMAESTNTVRERLRIVTRQINEIAMGDTKELAELKRVGKRSEQDHLLPAVINCFETIERMMADANMLTKAAIDGRLDTRADLAKHQGEYKNLMKGINETLDAVIGPLNVAAEYVDRISKGDLPQKITDKYNGDFNEIKNNLNNCIDNISALVADANLLAKAAVEGKLKTRADATKHLGDYRRIVEGVNNTLDSVINPVNEAMRMANEFAKCNFTARVDENLHVEGDFIKFKEALNSIGIEVSKAVNMINQQVMDLASSAEEANASIEEVASGAEHIARNAQAVSQNAERGNDGIGQVLRAMEDLNQTVTDVAQKAEKVSHLTENANTLSIKGTELAAQAERGMVSITNSSNDVDKIIVDIKAEMDKIGKIVGLISDLANQTNLLALNAAIEAARAGEAGRGFAVVATEVKSLAQESRASAENIADMIGTLQKKSMAAGEAVASSNREVKVGSEALSQTLRSFNDIVRAIEDISKNVVEVASLSEEQAATVEEVTASVNEVQELVHGTAKDAMDAAAAAEEASASIDQITKVVGGVNRIVDSVSKEMSKFRV
ncbi:MAG: methyl-accepting chemotaxis protein [Methanomicrobiales archaeon]